MLRHRNAGFSLVELMVVIAILGILSAIAYPFYTDYVDTAARGVMRQNMQSIRLFQEERKLSAGSYYAGTYDPADPDNSTGLKTVLGWSPNTDTDNIKYVVDQVTATSYRVTATDDTVSPARVEQANY